ncbi:MAG: hypothetical protein EXS67_04430 [Candidatus Margulisbacteria bacterium]|nr:hypothetical protein [Candidatus Margulisiibacteriota bacterium]
MDWPGLLSYIKEGETATIKFLTKAETEEDIAPLLVAMANSVGGKIFLGVDLRNCHLVGTRHQAEWIHYVIYQICKPAFQVGLEMVVKNDKHVLCITVPSGVHKPYYVQERCYVMDKGDPRLATTEEVSVMAELRNLRYPEEIPVIPVSVFTTSEEVRNEDVVSAVPEEEHVGVDESKIVLVTPSSHVLTSRQKETLRYLERQSKDEDESSIRNKTYRALFKVSHKTAHIELVDLVKRGYVASHGSGRSTCYRLVLA